MHTSIYETLAGPWKWAARKGIEHFHWEHLLVRCSARDCERHRTPQPAIVTRYSGIYFHNRWYHQLGCLRSDLVGEVDQLLSSLATNRSRPHRLPLGLLLINRGNITAENLREGLRRQREAGFGKLGYWLRQIVPLDESQLAAALGHQWGCPVFPPDRYWGASFAADGPPLPLLVSCKAVPAYSASKGRDVHIAFSERVDHTLLYALEEMLGCRTHACVFTESAVHRVLEELRQRSEGNEICFDSARDPGEIATTICSYARQMEATRVKLVRAGGYLWAGVFLKQGRRDLLFRMPGGALESRAEVPPVRIKELLTDADIRREGVLNTTVSQ